MDYKATGVDVEAGYKSVELMKNSVESTFRKEVIGGLGGFGGAFSLKAIKEMEHPVLISATDGVGTKLKLAFLLDRHDTVGIDCVAMCVNDLICTGAEPLYFIDYIACGKNIPEKIAAIVKGVATGCIEAGAALIGGETAEHPGLMPEDEYDLAGFAVGIVEKREIINGSTIKDGDVLIGLASSGVHSNGFSLIRRIFRIDEGGKEKLYEYHSSLGMTLGAALMTPTKIYLKAMKAIFDSGVKVKGCANITGGGFFENIPRMLPGNEKGDSLPLRLVVEKDSIDSLPIFALIKETGDLTDEVMYGTFNMGLGMVIAVDEKDVEKALTSIASTGEKAFVVGRAEGARSSSEGGLCLR